LGRDTTILHERIAGSTLRDIGARHGLTAEGARLIIAREGRRQIDELERRLLGNVGTNDVEVFVVPGHSGPDFDVALAHFAWALKELGKRGMRTRVHPRHIWNGVAFGVEAVIDKEQDQ
jgi:hypothetical protein